LIRFREDLKNALEHDPSMESELEVFLTSPGVHALWMYRVANKVWNWDLRILARVISNWARFTTGIEIHPAATIGRRLYIDHGMGVVIGGTAIIGDDVMMYHGVTLGAKFNVKTKRHPTIGNKVTLGADSMIIGDIKIGDGSSVGANTVVTKDLPAGSVIVGAKSRVIGMPEA
jgi:serine O-acetyltransferase